MAMSPRLLRPLARQAGALPPGYADLRVGLVAYWPMNEDASSGDVTAVDWTGRGNDLTSNNTVASVTGKTGLARQFVGDNSEYLSANSNADLTLGGDAWTLAFWLFVPEDAPTSGFNLLAKDDEAGREFAFEYNNGATDDLFIIFWDDPITYTDAARATITTTRGQWQFICCTHANNALTVSVTLNSTTTASTECSSYGTSAQPFTVGKRTYSGFEGFATCSIDELAIWSRALSGAEVAALYNSGNGIDLRQ
jgi:hypothetical protein